MSDGEYQDPRCNELIPSDEDVRPAPTPNELQAALARFGTDDTLDLVPGIADKVGVDVMPGLQLERAGGNAGLHPFKNGVIIRDLETLSEEERRAILGFLND